MLVFAVSVGEDRVVGVRNSGECGSSSNRDARLQLRLRCRGSRLTLPLATRANPPRTPPAATGRTRRWAGWRFRTRRGVRGWDAATPSPDRWSFRNVGRDGKEETTSLVVNVDVDEDDDDGGIVKQMGGGAIGGWAAKMRGGVQGE